MLCVAHGFIFGKKSIFTFFLFCRRAEAPAPAVVKYEQFEEGLRSQQLLKSEPQLASSFTEYKTEREEEEEEEEEEDRERTEKEEEERERSEENEEQTGQKEQDSGLRIKTELLGADYAQIPSVCSPPPPPVASPHSGDGITENDTQLNIKSEQLQAPGQTDFTKEVF
jgi:hypothetical protein